MCANADKVGLEGPGSGAEDKTEGVFRVDVQSREFCGRVLERRGYDSKPLAILVYIKGTQRGGGKFERWPFNRDGRLRDISKLWGT